jgi:class 3 adenylate cyclase/tetratricopeptide (TPR) repeat protein/type II secretory pathway predicted ATPase ExeA
MQCPKCNTENREGAKFCASCGASLVLVCAQCGTELPPHAKFCFNCATPVGALPPAPKEEPGVPALDEAIQRLVPKEFAERLLATRGQVGKERRIVTILFSDVKGSTAMAEGLDPEDVMEIMDGAFDVLIEPVYRYEGTVARLMGDAILAFFGAPIAHEDDPERACRAGLEIIKGAGRYAARLEEERGIRGFNVRVGINTGLVVVGEVGSDLRVEYTAMGDAINLAARMESAAEPGTILITEDTHKLIAPLFETEALGPIEVKGKTEPVSVYRVLVPKVVPLKPRGIAGLESPLVGRETEFRALQEAVEHLQAGVGGIVTVVGEAGIGKSRLVAEAQKRTLAKVRKPSQGWSSVQWVEGRCLSYGTSVAYLPWLDVLRALLEVSPEDTPVAVRNTVRQWVQALRLSSGQALRPDRFEGVYPYLGHLMSLPLEAAEEAIVRDLEGEQLKAGTFRAVETLLEGMAQQHPLVIVCEDLHWADPTSVELLERLLALTDRAPLLFICVFRPQTEHGCWRLRETAARTYGHRHTDLWLDPLSAVESETLVGNLLYAEGLPPKLKERILSHAEGNPFYVEEIIRSLMDSGAIVQDEATGRWQATQEVADIAIPDTLQGVLMARIDRLQEETKRVLQLAAVIGRIFLYRVLAAIAREERELDAHLLNLQREEMIRERARLPELEYIFKHHLTQEAAYNGLLRKERRGFHRRVAEALERLYPDRMEEQAGLLAHHWERAEEPEKAQHYLYQAGEQSRRQYANQEAISYFQRALALLKEAPPDAPRKKAPTKLYESLGDVLAFIDRYDEARTAYQNALARIPAQDRIGQGRLHRKTGTTWGSSRQPEKVMQAYDKAETALGQEPAEAAPEWWQEWVDIQLARTTVYYWKGKVREQTELVEKVRPVVEQHGTPVQRVRFFLELVVANNRRDRFIVSEQTLAYSRAYLEGAQESGSLHPIAHARFVLGFNLLWRGEFDEAKEQMNTALELMARMGDITAQTQCLTYLTIVYRKSGQVEEAMDYALRSLEAATSVQNPMYIGAARANLAWVAWRKVNLAEALEKGKAALESWQQSPGYPFQWLALYPLISVALAHDRIPEAVEYARGLLEPAQQALPDPLQTVLEEAIKTWERGEPEAARTHLDQAIELAQETGYL